MERCPIMPTYAAPSIQFVEGSGSWLTDREGKRYLDLLSGLAVTSLGHAHPAVAEAVAAQAQRLVHTSNLYATEHAAPVAQTLDRLLGGGGQVFFANSGAEANECAIKLARKWAGHGRYVVVSAYGSFTVAHTRRHRPAAKTNRLPRCPGLPAWRGPTWLRVGDRRTHAAVIIEPIRGGRPHRRDLPGGHVGCATAQPLMISTRCRPGWAHRQCSGQHAGVASTW
jgi:acetylornithine/succinyldiaminopimelate/putrescine aminotransferase